MTDETNAYAVKINGHTFISMDAAKSLVEDARMDGWNLALEEAAKIVDSMADDLARDHEPSTAIEWVKSNAAAIRAMAREP